MGHLFLPLFFPVVQPPHAPFFGNLRPEGVPPGLLPGGASTSTKSTLMYECYASHILNNSKVLSPGCVIRYQSASGINPDTFRPAVTPHQHRWCGLHTFFPGGWVSSCSQHRGGENPKCPARYHPSSLRTLGSYSLSFFGKERFSFVLGSGHDLAGT